MRIKYFLIIILGTLACMLLLDDLVPQPLVSHDSNLVYAMGRHHGRHHGNLQDRYEGPQGNLEDHYGRHHGNLEDPGGSAFLVDLNPSSAPPVPVPEPSTLLLLGTGLLGLGAYVRKKFFKK